MSCLGGPGIVIQSELFQRCWIGIGWEFVHTSYARLDMSDVIFPHKRSPNSTVTGHQSQERKIMKMDFGVMSFTPMPNRYGILFHFCSFEGCY